MLVAFDSAGERIEASRRTPSGRYTCPTCTAPVIAKPGRVKVPHFAHAAGADCPFTGESTSHLLAKRILADRFRAQGYRVRIEEARGRDRRVDVAVTLPHPTRPLRYAVEVQNSAIDVGEMFRRFVSDLEAGFWWTAWIFTGSRAAPLLRAEEGLEVRLPADLLAAHHPLVRPSTTDERERLNAICGGNPSGWLGERWTACPGGISELHGTKCLDDHGELWSFHLDDVTRCNKHTGRSTRLTSTKRVARKRATGFDLFGPVWATGDAQRRDFVVALAKHLPDDDTSAYDTEAVVELAARVLDLPRDQALRTWVATTVDHIVNGHQRAHGTTSSFLKLTASIYSHRWDNPLRAAPNGWPPVSSTPDAHTG